MIRGGEIFSGFGVFHVIPIQSQLLLAVHFFCETSNVLGTFSTNRETESHGIHVFFIHETGSHFFQITEETQTNIEMQPR